MILNERMNKALELLPKGKPFGKEPKSMDEQLFDYNQILQSQTGIQDLVGQYGEDEADKWLGEMYHENLRRQNG